MSRIAIALIASILLFAFSAQAETKVGAARSAVRRVQNDIRDLSRKVGKLTPAQKAQLKRALRGTDSDGDGIPNFFEDSVGSNSCDTDSDNDGVDDDDDNYEDDSDGDNDGHQDGDEVEKRGEISGFNDPSFMVGGQAFLLSSSTRFKRGIRRTDLEDGVCVKVQGHKEGSDVIADEIERCRGGGGSDD